MAPLLVVTAMGIITAPLFVHYLGKEMYAIYGYVSLFTGIFGFADLGLGVAVGRYIGVALGKGDQVAVREYWATGNLIAIPLLGVMALAFIVIGVWFGPVWFSELHPENVRMMQWAFVFGGVGLFISYYHQFWLVLSQAHLDFKFIGLLRSYFSVIQIIFTLWLAYVTHSPVALLLAGIGMSCVQLGIFIWHARENYHLDWSFREASFARAREMAGYTSKSFAAMMVNAFLGSIDRVILGKVPPADFTTYNFCNNFGNRIQGLSMAIMGPVAFNTTRSVGKGSHEDTAAIYNETFKFTFGWYALISIWTVCWHPVFLRLWLWKDDFFIPVTPVFTPLVIAFCLSALANISTAQLGALNRMGVELGFTIVRCLFLGICVWLGWVWGGLVGVAWGVLCSRIAVVAQDLYVIRLIGGGGWLAGSTWEHLLIQCGVGLAFYFAARTLPHYLPSSIEAEGFWKTLFAVRWQLGLALLHGILVAAWLSRHQLKKIPAFFRQ